MFKTDPSKILILTFLLVVIPISLYLIQKQQILKGRATGESELAFIGLSGNPPRASSQNVALRLTYNQANPPVSPTPNPEANSCSFNLTDGQTITGNTLILVNGSRSDPSYYLSLQIVDSRLGSFQAVSAKANNLFTNISSTLFQNGPATLECRIQTDQLGGTIISSRRIILNVTN